ncbi:DUF4825 domain-containing protein [Desulfofalx alkaliphila]|uniref:DUF4825 domain-containing protein n=1 Tax=Desulfofalx alkaliphila TaxID=105483 RepID=UPI0009FDFAE9|nr:DUF4825 domain-containing protein [Desulfofalx alkaliphila]
MKMAKLFKNNKITVALLGLLCIALLSGVLLTKAKGINPGDETAADLSARMADYEANVLLKYKSPYIGNASNVSNLLSTLPLGEYKQGIALDTEEEPYGLNVNYHITELPYIDRDYINKYFRTNSVVLFSLIDNLDVIGYKVKVEDKDYHYQYTRDSLQGNFEQDLREYSKDKNQFENLLSIIKTELLMSTGAPMTLEQAVSKAIISQESPFRDGECATEGHVILDTKEKRGVITCYTIAGSGSFGFENGIFTSISGTGATPTVMTFRRGEDGSYTLLEYKRPMDGDYYVKSIKKMFPRSLYDTVLSAHEFYPKLSKQQEEQARAYLQSIGRNAQVSADYVEKELLDIDVGASNKLFGEIQEYNPYIANYPYWVGTVEKIEDGERYIYETSQGKTADGYDLVSFKKTKEDGTLVEEFHYEIVGSEPQLILAEGRPELIPH